MYFFELLLCEHVFGRGKDSLDPAVRPLLLFPLAALLVILAPSRSFDLGGPFSRTRFTLSNDFASVPRIRPSRSTPPGAAFEFFFLPDVCKTRFSTTQVEFRCHSSRFSLSCWRKPHLLREFPATCRSVGAAFESPPLSVLTLKFFS